MEQEAVRTIEQVSALSEEQSLTKEQLMGYLRQMMEIRALENNIANLLAGSCFKALPTCTLGRRPSPWGAVGAIRSDDLITSTHRGHGHAHAHGDSAAGTPEAKQEHSNKMMAEVLGKSGGYCKGKAARCISPMSPTGIWAPQASSAGISLSRWAPLWPRKSWGPTDRGMFLR